MKSAESLTFAISSAVVLSVLTLFAFASKPWQRLLDKDEITVSVAAVKLESRPLVIRLSGELQQIAVVDVTSRLAGRLTEVKFKTGDSVSAGAVVATVSSGEVLERAQVAEADLKAARKQLQEKEQLAAAADKQLARQRELYRRDLIARREVEEAEIHAATARAQLDLVQAQIAQAAAIMAQARQVQQLAPIVAPISGVVAGALSAGAPVNQARAILSIADIDRLKLVGEVAAEFAELIRDGMTVRVAPREGLAAAREGTLSRVNGKTKTTDVVMVEITVDNRDRGWQMGASVDASLILDRLESVLTIPRSALHNGADKHHVYLIAAGRAIRRAVKVVDASGNAVMIGSGLNSGDMVIVNFPGEIEDGRRVIVATGAK